MDDGDFQVLQSRTAQVETVSAFTQCQPSRAGNKPVDDIGFHAAAIERDGLIAGLGRHRDNIACENVANDLQILVRVGIIKRGRTCILQRLNHQREADLVAVIDNGHHVLRVVLAEDKRLRIALGRERECECTSDLAVICHDGFRGIPVDVRAENRDLPRCQHFKIVHLAGFHIALSENVYACGFIVDLDISAWFYHLV